MRESNPKKLIVNAAIDLFGRWGYQNVSMRDIGAQVGVNPGGLYNYFDSKEAILEEAIDEAARFLSHLQYSAEMILEKLQGQSPRRILKEFVSYYYDEDDTFRMAVYRLLYMEMYNNPRILDIVYHHFIRHPVENLRLAMDVLTEAGAIPKGDSLAIAELWNRTSLVYGYLAAHDPENVPWKEYDGMTDFFIDMAVRGVHMIPVDKIDVSINHIVQEGSPANTKELILHKALDLFSQRGYASVTMRQIAQAVGIKAGSLYNHFTGKAGIMQEVADHFLESFQQYNLKNADFYEAVEQGDLQEIIHILSCSYAPMEHMEAYKVYRILFREQYVNKTLGKIFVDTLRQDKQMICSALEKMVEQKLIRVCDSWKIATAYIHIMRSLSIEATAEIHLVNEDYIRPRVVALLVSLIEYGYLDEHEAAATITK